MRGEIMCLVSFADARIKVADHEEDFMDALRYASHNLELRYNIHLEFVAFTRFGDGYLVLHNVNDPDSFNLGNHLRGISMYLLDKTDFNYSDYFVGKRLLNYRRT